MFIAIVGRSGATSVNVLMVMYNVHSLTVDRNRVQPSTRHVILMKNAKPKIYHPETIVFQQLAARATSA